MKHLLLNHLLFLLWSLGCVAAGALLSRRLIITTTDLYAAMWHDAQAAQRDAFQLRDELNTLKARIVDKLKAAEAAGKKIIT